MKSPAGKVIYSKEFTQYQHGSDVKLATGRHPDSPVPVVVPTAYRAPRQDDLSPHQSLGTSSKSVEGSDWSSQQFGAYGATETRGADLAEMRMVQGVALPYDPEVTQTYIHAPILPRQVHKKETENSGFWKNFFCC
eukprot:GHVP01053975.1.p2 GENE.GHVP01053975.1~~GHVP01053975.1.p2  ORF type:complete len:136 (+),score=23.80 GHVP01053975.1:103-510(+)